MSLPISVSEPVCPTRTRIATAELAAPVRTSAKDAAMDVP
jgi:hypothetical protein